MLNEKKQKLIESSIMFSENPVTHFAQTNVFTQKINISLVIKNLEKRLENATTIAEVNQVKNLAQKNINGLKKYWDRNTKSMAKPITRAKENTSHKAIERMEDIIKRCDAKIKTLKKQ